MFTCVCLDWQVVLKFPKLMGYTRRNVCASGECFFRFNQKEIWGDSTRELLYCILITWAMFYSTVNHRTIIPLIANKIAQIMKIFLHKPNLILIVNNHSSCIRFTSCCFFYYYFLFILFLRINIGFRIKKYETVKNRYFTPPHTQFSEWLVLLCNNF